MGTGLYSFLHGYTNPQRDNNRNLGTQIEITKSNILEKFYQLFISAPGDGTTSNSGRIHFVNLVLMQTAQYLNGQEVKLTKR